MKPNHIPGTEHNYGGPLHKMNLRGRLDLMRAVNRPEFGVDVGSQALADVKRLAAWWGVPLKISALGYGAYRVRGAAQPSH